MSTCPGCGRCRECGQFAPVLPQPYPWVGPWPYTPTVPYPTTGPIWISQPTTTVSF
jgi:hypothetical protein